MTTSGSLDDDPADRPMSPALAEAYAHVEATVRRQDPDRWLAGLWAPADRRRHLYALYAFSGEVARVRDAVSDPLPGEVRLRWWADVLAGTRGSEGEGHPVAACLLDTIARFGLPREPLDRLIEARIFDLYDDPVPSLDALDTYCEETVAPLIELGCRILSRASESASVSTALAVSARSAGRAWGLTGLLRSMPFHASRGQIFLPADLMSAHGIRREDVLNGRSSPGLVALLADLRAHVRAALRETRRMIPAVPTTCAPAYLAVALVEPLLERMDRLGGDPFTVSAELPPWRRLVRLWWAARRARRAGRLGVDEG